MGITPKSKLEIRINIYHIRRKTMKPVLIGLLAATILVTFYTSSASANTTCQGTVRYVGIRHDGSSYEGKTFVKLSNGYSYDICYINADDSGARCQYIQSLLLAAMLSGKTVKIERTVSCSESRGTSSTFVSVYVDN